MNIKTLLQIIKYQYKGTSNLYYKHLKKYGIKMGCDVNFYSPWTITVDTQRPWMIEIGNHVHIAAGASILQHGYDWAILQKKYGEVLGSSGKVVIGDNVFIGTKTTILKGVQIGNNVIIGANSLVNKNCIEEGVYAGNPVRYIMSLSEYKEKRERKQLDEAYELAIEFKKRYGKFPEKEVFREYFWLFEERKSQLCKTFEDVHKLSNNFDLSTEIFNQTFPIFKGYKEFIKFVEDRYEKETKK